MKILFFSTYFHPYLSGITASPRLALEHLAQKHEVTVLAFSHTAGLPSREKTGRLTVIRLPYLTRLSKGFISPQSFPVFFREAGRHDAIVLNLPEFEGFPLALLGRLRGKKVYSLLNCMVELPGGPAEKIIQAGLETSVRLQLRLSRKILTYTQDYFDSIPSLAAYKNRVEIVSPCMKEKPEDPAFRNKLKRLKNKDRWVGFAGRMAREKGIEYLIAALKKTETPRPVLVFAGPEPGEVVGENAYAQAIRQEMNESRIPHLFLGRLTEGQMGAFYRTIDILALPSVNRTEAYGMVQAEAMMAGTPVVASSLPGVRVPVQATGMGLTAAPGDSSALARAMEKILDNRHAFSGVKQKAKARSLFSLDKALASYDRIFT